MKAVRLHEYEQPPSLDDVPQPNLADHDGVLIRAGGAGGVSNRPPLIDGWFADVLPPERPLTLGYETGDGSRRWGAT